MIQTEVVKKVRTLVDTQVIVEPGYTPWGETREQRHRRLTDWARELMEFFRDH